MEMLLSICIPTLNRAAFIGMTLDSIIPQLTDDVEVVIVDGGSQDGTAEIVASRAKSCPSIRYHMSQHVTDGAPKPSNAGFDRDCDYCVSLARGRYCWILPDDDLLVPDAIATIRQHASDNVALIVANAQIRDDKVESVLLDRILAIQEDQHFNSDAAEKLFELVGKYLTYVGGVVVRRHVEERVGAAVVDDKEAVAVQGYVGRRGAAGVVRPLREINRIGGDLDAPTYLNCIAGTLGRDLLIKEVGEVGGLGLEGCGAHVG